MTEEETLPQTTAALLDRIDGAWARLQATMQALDETQLLAAGVDGWSVKDHMAHVAAWERSLIALLEGRDRQAALGVPGGDDQSEQALNAAIRDRYAHLSLGEVQRLMEETHAHVRSLVERMGDADLVRPYESFQPRATHDRRQDPVIYWIAGNTFGHYEEHRSWIASMSGTQRP